MMYLYMYLYGIDPNCDVPLYFISVPLQKVGCMAENPSFVR